MCGISILCCSSYWIETQNIEESTDISLSTQLQLFEMEKLKSNIEKGTKGNKHRE